MSKYANNIYEKPDQIEGIYNIGWLGWGHDFPRGEVDTDLLYKLLQMMDKRGGVSITFERAIHSCPLCKEHINRPRSESGLPDIPLGITELWIPYQDKVYVAPNMIYHLIEFHHYQPPQVFTDAVMAFDSESDWDAETFYESIDPYKMT